MKLLSTFLSVILSGSYQGRREEVFTGGGTDSGAQNHLPLTFYFFPDFGFLQNVGNHKGIYIDGKKENHFLPGTFP